MMFGQWLPEPLSESRLMVRSLPFLISNSTGLRPQVGPGLCVGLDWRLPNPRNCPRPLRPFINRCSATVGLLRRMRSIRNVTQSRTELS